MEITQKQKILKPTPKQRAAARRLVENLYSDKPEDLGVILEDIGYSKSIALNPFMVTESVGFKQAVRDLGLTEELVTNALVDDIKKKPQSRVQELKLAAEVLGMVKREEPDEKPKSVNTYNFIFSPETQEKVRKIEEEIKQQLIKPHVKTD